MRKNHDRNAALFARAILRDLFYVSNDDDHRADANDEHELVALPLIVR